MRTKRNHRRDAADSLWREVILERAKGRCESCGVRSDALECAHIITRARQRTRCLPQNGRGLCHRCHRLEHDERGSRPFWEGIIGTTEYQRLYDLAWDPLWKRPPGWWVDRRAALSAELTELRRPSDPPTR